jgi:hypothetical protein
MSDDARPSEHSRYRKIPQETSSTRSDEVCAYQPGQYSDRAVDETWERHGYEVGRLMHAAHKRDLLTLGFADHPFKRGKPKQGCARAGCGQLRSRHHPDMVDWDHLPPGLQAATIARAKIAFTVGYRQGLAAHAWSLALGGAKAEVERHA